MYLSYVGPVSYVFSSWVLSVCTVSGWLQWLMACWQAYIFYPEFHQGGCNAMAWWLQHPLFIDRASNIFFFFFFYTYKSNLKRSIEMQTKRTWNSHLMNTSRLHLYMDKSHWKLTGNWQNDCCTTKAIWKIHKELGSKGRELIRSAPVPLGGDSEEKRDYMCAYLPWGRAEPHVGFPSSVAIHKEDEPPWLVGRPVGLTRQ